MFRFICTFIFLLSLLLSVTACSGLSDSSDSAIDFQSLYQSEINPNFVQEMQASSTANVVFDASLEEILHMLTDQGWAKVYPAIFGKDTGISLTTCMDTARGGQFTSVPETYPDGAWYTYDDESCDYGCMASEYIYWGASTMIGAQAQAARAESISNEWSLSTRDEVVASDNCLATLLTNDTYKLPNLAAHLPDGTYAGSTLTVVSTMPSFMPAVWDEDVTKAVYVFNIPIIAATGVSDASLLHAGSVMAKYLDRNEDGTPDHQDVVDSIVTNQGSVLMAETEEAFELLMEAAFD